MRKCTFATLRVRAGPGNPRRGWLTVGPLALPVALGRSGIRANKREGDGGTPRGRFRLRRLWWLAELGALEKLEVLKLDSAAVTDKGVETLKAFRRLKTLNLYHTLATEGAVEELKKALPGCGITWDRDANLPTRRGS